MSMEESQQQQQGDGFSLNVPLLVDQEKQHDNHQLNGRPTTDDNNNNKDGTTSFIKTCFNGLNALSGVGILSIPYALSSGGWLSLILFFALATAACYSGLLIKRCMDKNPDIRTYPDIGELAFGNTGRLVVSISMYIELYLVATGFLILEGDNLNTLIPSMQFELAGLKMVGKQFFVIIVGITILPTVWLDNLSLLSYISASGVLASAVILCSILWTAVSLYAFCYCAHPVFPTLYTSMRKKHQFSNVLFICFALCTICYASMAIFGYLMFGSEVQSQITLNLPTDKLSSRVAIYTTLVNPISKYALMVTPIVNAMKKLLPGQYNKRVFGLLISTTLVISTVIVALVVPFFGYLMSLVGALLSVTASILLPCLCYLKISGTYQRFGCEMIIIGCIIMMGIGAGIFGTYTSLVDIIEHF
ncbi:putative Amino acid transporter [Quillaja saponaria]|uniref:Amino acid transporter n=1 Tax=Quillaja saponaria TaxID=32244 RepID=A0AAD7Q407_QUISA|nr:putative Amino acid transporter [Quillaja saponaria]